MVTLNDELIEFFNFINEPPQYEDKRMVRDYRHELARLWAPLHNKLNAALNKPAPPSDAEPLYYVKGNTIFQRPTRTARGNVMMGFSVCEVLSGVDAVELCAIMNRGDPTTGA